MARARKVAAADVLVLVVVPDSHQVRKSLYLALALVVGSVTVQAVVVSEAGAAVGNFDYLQ